MNKIVAHNDTMIDLFEALNKTILSRLQIHCVISAMADD